MTCELTSQPSSGAVKVWIGATSLRVTVSRLALETSSTCFVGHAVEFCKASQSDWRLRNSYLGVIVAASWLAPSPA